MKAAARFGNTHALVNNAPILYAAEVVHRMEENPDTIRHMNANGNFLIIQAILPLMKTQDFGRICNISSNDGKRGAPKQAHHAASKVTVRLTGQTLKAEGGLLVR